MLEIHNLTKKYGSKTIISDWDYTFENGMKKMSERLVGKPKQHHKEWCFPYYTQDFQFYLHKELTRVWANRDKFITYFMMSLAIMICNYYLPQWFLAITCIALLMLSYQYNCAMYETEQNLLLMGFIDTETIPIQLFCKLLTCFGADFILCVTLMAVWPRMIICAFGIACLCSAYTIAKHFRKVLRRLRKQKMRGEMI